MFAKRTDNRQSLGRWGEDAAADWLKARGYRILERNYRTRSGEIDLIARTGDTLVFVEVKTRRTPAFGTPAEAVTARKQQQILRVAQEYLQGRAECAVRFDVIAVTGIDGLTIEQLINAFGA